MKLALLSNFAHFPTGLPDRPRVDFYRYNPGSSTQNMISGIETDGECLRDERKISNEMKNRNFAGKVVISFHFLSKSYSKIHGLEDFRCISHAFQWENHVLARYIEPPRCPRPQNIA